MSEQIHGKKDFISTWRVRLVSTIPLKYVDTAYWNTFLVGLVIYYSNWCLFVQVTPSLQCELDSSTEGHSTCSFFRSSCFVFRVSHSRFEVISIVCWIVFEKHPYSIASSMSTSMTHVFFHMNLFFWWVSSESDTFLPWSLIWASIRKNIS